MPKQNTSVKVYTYSGFPSNLTGVAGSLTTILDTCIAGYNSKTISSISVTTKIATCTTTTTHGYTLCQVVTIAGCSNSDLNGEWKIAEITSTTSFKFYTNIATDTTGSGGTVQITGLSSLVKTAGSPYNKYKFAAGTQYLCVDDSINTAAKVRIVEDLADTNPTTDLYVVKSETADTAARNWYLFANDKMLYLVTIPSTTSSYLQGVMFGNFVSLATNDAYHTAIIGGTTNSYADTDFTIFNNSAGGYLCRSYTQTGSAISAMRFSGMGSRFTNTMSYSSLPSLKRPYVPVTIWETKEALRGMLPGIYSPVADANNGAIYTSADRYMFNIKAAGSSPNTHIVFDATGPWES